MFNIRLRYYVRLAWRSIWFRPAAYSLLATVALAATPVIQPLIPEMLVYKIDRALVDRVLDMLTASMLAVAIFSLSTMVTQLNAAAESATPRARTLLSEDRTAHNAISTFIGTFLFAVLGVIGLHLNLYSETGLFVLFVLSLVLIVLVIVNLILWIRRLSEMGGVGEAMLRIRGAAETAFDEDARRPWLGGRRAVVPPPDGSIVKARATGFVQTIDTDALNTLADKLGQPVHVLVRPGDFLNLTLPLTAVASKLDDDDRQAVQDAVVIGNERDFYSDPRYGVVALAEIGSRALSPGVNDPGTAIDAIATLLQLLTDWRTAVADASPKVEQQQVFVPAIDPAEILVAGFRGIARDSAGMVEVGLRLQQALGALASIDPEAFGPAAREIALAHLARAREAIPLDDEFAVLEQAFQDCQPKAAGALPPKT